MRDDQADEIISLLRQLVEETKTNTETLEDVKNIFVKYDADVMLLDEELRDG